MRLLSRPEASSQASQQRKEQADSGMYIAGRVDRLRETLVQLETQQREFVKGNRKAIDEALSEGLARKEALLSEIAALERRKSEAMKPLDEEWEKVRDAGSESAARKAEIDRKTALCEAKESEVDNLVLQAYNDRTEASRTLQEALEIFEKAKTELLVAEQLRTKTGELVEKSGADIAERLKVIEMEARRLEYDRKHYADFEKELKKRENDLKDREKRLTIKEHATSNRPKQPNGGNGVRPRVS